jgi:limonene-1,2-epoxide hydrolase
VSATTNGSGAAETVRRFLRATEARDLQTVSDCLAPDAVWINVTLPAVRGRERIMRIFQLGVKTGTRVRIHVHNLATHGSVVLTERTDALGIGRFEQRFWVYGRFEIENGEIKVWRDSFDWLDILISLVRGFAGTFVAPLNRRWPGE